MRGIDLARDLDAPRIADSQPLLVRQADVGNRHRIEPHHLRRNRIDGHLILRGQHHVLHDRIHRPRSGTVPGCRAVHDREQTRVDFLLDREQVHERLVNPRMGVVTACVPQTAERVLHGAGRRRVDVAFRRRQVHDVLAEEEIGNADAFGIDSIQHAHPRGRLITDPFHVLVLEVVEDGHAVFPEDGNVMIEILPLERIRDHRLVLHADLVRVAAPGERLNRAFELPRRGVRGRKREMPGNVVLEDGRAARCERLRGAPEIHESIDIGKDGVWRDANDRDQCSHEPCWPGCRPADITSESPAYC